MKGNSLVTSFCLVATILVFPSGVWSQSADGRVGKAQELFQAYLRLERQFSPEVADLYADTALIRNKRTYPTGHVRELGVPAPQYKDLIRRAMPLAKHRGDTNAYSQVTYTAEGDGVRVTASRFSELKKYASPLSLLVRPSSSGSWLIYEELSESRP